MKTIIYYTFVLLFSINSLVAQTSKELKSFIPKGFQYVDAYGPGLKNNSGDILLMLKSHEEDENNSLVILRKTNDKITKVAENNDLMMSKDMLGTSGSNYPELNGNILFINYTLGSGSAQSDVSIVFEKSSDNNYYFKTYTSVTQNYGVENLFSREKITNAQTGKISFSEANETLIFTKSKMVNNVDDRSDVLYKSAKQYAKYIPEGWRLAALSEGDLNLDGFKKDLLLILYDEESCNIQILFQQKDGSYKKAKENDNLILTDEMFNVNNLRTIIKNGYFTIEQRMATDNNDFDHRYFTFKYDAAQKNIFLHRYDIEHYSGFNLKPSPNVTHLTTKDFGAILFDKLDYVPGDYFFEPNKSTINGTIIKKQFYGRPNYGETPEKDEKVYVFILKPDYPINVFAGVNQADAETSDKSIRNINEIQIFSNKKTDFSIYLGKKVTLKGVLITARTGGQYTKVILQVESVVEKK